MSGEETSRIERAIAACYATWADNYYDQYYGAAAAYPPVHADVILTALKDAGIRIVPDAGCGPASFLEHMGNAPIAWHGFDLTPEMVEEAHRVALAMGRPDTRVWVGSLLDDAAFTPPDGNAPPCDDRHDRRHHGRVLRLVIAPRWLRGAVQLVDQVGSRGPECFRDGLHRESSPSGDRASQVCF